MQFCIKISVSFQSLYIVVVYFNTMSVVLMTWHWMAQWVIKKELDRIQREAVVL